MAGKSNRNASGGGSAPVRSALLVQGTRSARQSTVQLLAGAVQDVREAADSFEALCELARARPRVVVMDQQLPHMSGCETCALLRGSPLFRDMRIVLVGEADNLADRVRSELAGADAWLVKPFRREELIAALTGSEAER